MIERAQAEAIVERLEAGWNAGDAETFAAPFAPDADFVNVLGEHAKSRAQIAAGHSAIFSGIYANSRVVYSIEQYRPLTDDVALAHLGATLDVPAGERSGVHHARLTIVLQQSAGDIAIAALHNTFARGGSDASR